MRRSVVAAVALAVSTTQAWALCKDGPPFECTINGKPGERQCVGGHITPCIPLGGATNPTANGTVQPKFLVLTVVYAPPGTAGGKSSNTSTSTVSYGSGSTAGTATSSSSSFKQGVSVKATVGASAGVVSASVGVSFGLSNTTGDSSSLNISKSTSTTIQATGPSVDGIDHDHDVIYLWLNPTLNLSVSGKSAAWSFTGTGTADIQYAYVAWLKNPATMPAGLAQRFQHYGLTTADYATILQQDPYASASPPVSNRYQSLNTTFPYEPPLDPKDTPPTFTFTASASDSASSGTNVENDYNVGLSVKVSASFVVSASLETDATWAWSNKSSQATSTGSTQSASVNVGGPAFGYSGPTDVQVYYDRIYKTFFFRFVPADAAPGLRGVVKDAAGKPMALKEVDVTANGQKFRTFTNAKGEYRLFGAMNGPVTLQAGKTLLKLPQVTAGKNVELLVK